MGIAPEDRLAIIVNSVDKSILEPSKTMDIFYQIKNMGPLNKNYLQYTLSEDKPIYIIPISDVHFGAFECNSHKLKAVIDLIQNTPNCYTILLGDLAETATKESVGMAMFGEDEHLPDQIKLLCNALKPLADQGKILGMLTGNHEMRVAQLIGINPMELVADKIGAPYLGFQGYIMVQVGTQKYKIMCHHGVGGGASMAGKVKSVERLASVAEADIHIAGHTHGLHYHYDHIMTFSDDGQIVPRKRHYVVAGSFLEYWGGYAEMKLLQPSATGVAVIELLPDRKEVRVTI